MIIKCWVVANDSHMSANVGVDISEQGRSITEEFQGLEMGRERGRSERMVEEKNDPYS